MILHFGLDLLNYMLFFVVAFHLRLFPHYLPSIQDEIRSENIFKYLLFNSDICLFVSLICYNETNSASNHLFYISLAVLGFTAQKADFTGVDISDSSLRLRLRWLSAPH